MYSSLNYIKYLTNFSIGYKVIQLFSTMIKNLFVEKSNILFDNILAIRCHSFKPLAQYNYKILKIVNVDNN